MERTADNVEGLLYGYNLFGEPIRPKPSGPVAEKFGFSPFSVFDARSGEWQSRKRAWVSIGIESEIGRDAVAYTCNSDTHGDKYDYMPDISTGTSIFDPTLCECIYRWFSSKNDQVVDPFAGGSVRGIIAGILERDYWGCDLRHEQIEANKVQVSKIKPDIYPIWVSGDSTERLAEAPEADLVFSCPPYGDLEKYCNDPRDLSNMEWHTFVAAYKRIILRTCKKLRQNRFACFVVGNFRDGRGYYRDLVGTTISAFHEQGLRLYNDAVLITPIGSACVRVTKQFEAGRKFAKVHQNVLVFCKGDWREAVKRLNSQVNT